MSPSDPPAGKGKSGTLGHNSEAKSSVTREEGTSDVIAEHAKLKQRIEKAAEEWFLLNEELEEEMARQQANA